MANNIKSSILSQKNIFFAICIWISIILLFGTHIRARYEEGLPTIDALVLIRMIICFLGLMMGIVLFRSDFHLGLGGQTLLLYIVAGGISAVLNQFTIIILGYWFQFLAIVFLTFGLVHQFDRKNELKKLETIWFLAILIILIKDTLLYILVPSFSLNETNSVFRLGGIGGLNFVQHANKLSFMASLAFWITVGRGINKYKYSFWILRIFLIYVILAARSRLSIIAFIIGGITWLILKYKKNHYIVILIICFILFVINLFILGISLGDSFHLSIYSWLSRGDPLTLVTLTGRNVIWPQALNMVISTPYKLIFGHGYVIGSRILLNNNLPFIATHCHNAFLEVLFGTGILGLFPFLLMNLYGFKWVLKFKENAKRFTDDFAIRASIVIVMFLFSALTEVRIVNVVDPFMPLYFLYILALDKKSHKLKIKFSKNENAIIPNLR